MSNKLEAIDQQLRNDFEFGVVENGSMFPDINQEPLFLKTLPEVDITGNAVDSNSFGPVSANTGQSFFNKIEEKPVYIERKEVEMMTGVDSSVLSNTRTQELSNKANTEQASKKQTDYANKTLGELLHLIAFNLLKILEDLMNKPSGIDWKDYLVDIFSQQDRIFSMGVFLILTSLVLVFFSAK
jgi:hypothetical protein